MDFEKWHALGNDYLIVEQVALPWDLTPERIRLLCHRNFGPGADGVLLLSEGSSGAVATLRIFNPDGSEASLSGNGAREAAMYLHARGWTDQATFSIDTAAGRVEPTVIDRTTCAMKLGQAATSGPDWPGGPPDGVGTAAVGSGELTFRFVDVGNPQLSFRIDDAHQLEELDLPAIGPALESDARFPNRTNVSFWTPTKEGIRARIFERGVGETLSSGTGASGAAVAAFLEGHGSPVNVTLDGGDLEVSIGDDLSLTLTGWAVPVYRGTTSTELETRLA